MSEPSLFTDAPAQEVPTAVLPPPPPLGEIPLPALPDEPEPAPVEETGPMTLDALLADTSFRIPQDMWAEHVQDVGKAMSADEVAMYGEGANKGRPKHKTKLISHNNTFYPKLYRLASLLWGMMDSRRSTFPRLPRDARNKSNVVHIIGNEIAGRRVPFQRADIHNAGTACLGFMDVIQTLQAERVTVFIYSQELIVRFLYDKYGPEGEKKRITTDDKIRVAGILFNCPDVRKYIGAMIGKTKATGNRDDLDASPGQKKAGFRFLYTKFIDEEVVVNLPPAWNTPETAASIDTKTTEGTFDQHGRFNPNNLARIALPWTQSEVTKIFDKVKSEYNAAMDNYTKGTGGGSGAPSDFAVWEERDPTYVVQYADQVCNLYLAAVHMWDKEYQFVFVSIKAPMPNHCVIDDGYDAIAGDNDDDFIHRGSIPTPALRGKTASARKENGYLTVLEKMSKGREEVKENTEKIVGLLESIVGGGGNTASDEKRQVMKDLKDTNDLIDTFEKKNDKLKIELRQKKKRAIGDISSAKLQKSIKKIKASIKKNEKMIDTIEVELEDHRIKLDSIRAASIDVSNDDINVNDSDDDEDSDSDSDRGDLDEDSDGDDTGDDNN